MGDEDSFEKTIYFTKCSVYILGCSWPPSRTATKWEIMKSDIRWFITFISGLCLGIPLLFSMYVYRHDIRIVTQSACMLSGCLNLLIKTVVFRVYRERTQILIEEMENFSKNQQPHERVVLQRYVARYSHLHTLMCGINYAGCSYVVFAPLVFSYQPFPTHAAYPFNIDSGILMYLVYIHQGIACFQAASGLCVDCQNALIMWFAGARLEILAEELADVTDSSGFQHFVPKHKKIMSYALDVSNTICYIVFASFSSYGVVSVMSALQIFGNQPSAIKMEFGLALMIGTLNLFISAWPADNLINACDLLANAAYNTSWMEMSPKMARNLIMVLQRCQRSIVVSIGGFIPSLSLRFYASFVSALFSYFTTIRIVMLSED